MFEKPLSIKEFLPQVNKLYFLPAIQREYVWKEEQIINLFDSMLKGYPIGSFLFWKVQKPNIEKYDFYTFCENQTKGTINENLLAVDVKEQLHQIVSILDGQQRFTSIMIGLLGSYDGREMYISLSSKYDVDEMDEYDLEYRIEFKKDVNNNEEEHWFKVKDIMEMDIKGITKYANQHNINNLGIDILAELYDLVSSNLINYYLETADDIQRVLTIFVRVNSGGTHLSYADLLLSMATSNWGTISARKEINNLVNDINGIEHGFKISKDFLLKTSLYLLGREIRFKVSNYEDGGMKEIEENWEKIKKAIFDSFIFLSNIDFYHKNLNSNYVASVIAYYFFNFENINLENEKSSIVKFVRTSLLKGIYSSSLDTILKSLRESLDNSNSFSAAKFNRYLPDNKQLNFSKKEIKTFANTKYTQKNFFLLLSIIYDKKPVNISPIYHKDLFPIDNDQYKYLANYEVDNAFKVDNYLSHNLEDIDVISQINIRKQEIEETLINIL